MYNIELKKFISRHNLTQKEFARRVDISEDYLSSIIRRHNEITESLFQKIKTIYPDFPDSLRPSSYSEPEPSVVVSEPIGYDNSVLRLLSSQLDKKDAQIRELSEQLSRLLIILEKKLI